MWCLRPCVCASQEDCITKSLVCCDSHATWPVVFLQASSMATCYTIARIVAARKTYHPGAYGAQLGAIMAVLGVFVAGFVCQGLLELMWDLTSHCAVTFNLPPCIREKANEPRVYERTDPGPVEGRKCSAIVIADSWREPMLPRPGGEEEGILA